MDASEANRALAALGPEALLQALGVKGARRSGRQLRCPCPVHGGSSDAFAIGYGKDGVIVWACHSVCGRGGDALALVAEVRGLNLRTQFPEVLREATALAGHAPAEPQGDKWGGRCTPQQSDLEVAAHRARSAVLERLLGLCPLEGEGLRYLTQERLLSAETCRAWRVGYVADHSRVARELLAEWSAEVLDELGVVYQRGCELAFTSHRLLVPIIRDGRPVYVQGRALGRVAQSHQRFRSMRGSVPCLLGVDTLADQSRPVLLCEGLVDTLTGYQAWGESHAVVGILGAGGLKPELATPLRGRTVVLALDPDKAGEAGATHAVAILNRLGCDVQRLQIPAPAKDLNDWWLREKAA